MKIVSFSPFERMDSLRSQIDRVFADVEETTKNSYSFWQPAVELLDDADNLILRLLLAGVNRQAIDIEVTRESVTISGERHQLKPESSHCLYSEFKYGKFHRQISLPIPIVNTQAKANYQDGILTLVLPKVEEAKQQVVKIALEASSSTASLPEDSTELAELATA
ncbi:MAG: Hsp20/alpha crystallin family protein [Pleurocapsa sp.]